jgi:hypothetical protein
MAWAMQEVEQCMEQLPKVREKTYNQQQLNGFVFFSPLRCVNFFMDGHQLQIRPAFF